MLKKILERQVSSKSLGLFRIIYSTVLLLEVLRMNYFEHLIFDRVPYFERGELLFGPIFTLWIITLGFLIIGLKTRYAALLNYVIGFFVIGTIHAYEYHMFYTYMTINFLMIFSPVSKSYSLDNLLERINKSSINKEFKQVEMISEFYYYMFVFFGIAVVYLDSTSYKLVCRMWLDGLGMWLPASAPFAVNVNLTPLLNMEILMKMLGYLTLVFELVFIVLFWNKYFKIIFILIGVGLHVGIYILFPIPQFAEGVVGLYLLMLPFNYPERLAFLKRRKKTTVFYNANSALVIRKKIIIEFLDVFKCLEFKPITGDLSMTGSNSSFIMYGEGNKAYSNIEALVLIRKKMVYTYPFSLLLSIPFLRRRKLKIFERISNSIVVQVGFVSPTFVNDSYFINDKLTVNQFKNTMLLSVFYFLFVLQVLITVRSPFVYNYFSRYTVYRNFVDFTKPITKFSKWTLGITNHGVFSDSHFIRYNHIIKVDYVDKSGKRVLLPVITEEGMPGDYLKAFVWAKWTFRVNGPEIKKEKVESGVRDFTAFWLHNSNIIDNPKGDYDFVISCKRIDYTMHFEKDFLNKQIEKPWIEIGKAQWNNGQFQISVLDIEKEIK